MNIIFNRRSILKYLCINLGISLCISLFLLGTTISFADDHAQESPTGMGFEMGISNQGFQAGPLYRFKNVSFAMDMRGLTGTYGDTTVSSFITDFRAAMNIELGPLYFIQVGLDWQQIWSSRETKSNTNGSLELGPMIGVQRFFPSSSFFLLAYIIPYQYNSFSESTDGVTGSQHQFLANGALLFGLLF